mmetsp:Transcript_66175/g.190952  ORF Transcript_66175/g.190952 Transcript_66175/m.190952 type:complete len:240 (+) Transcript_66175:773-1492(+)
MVRSQATASCNHRKSKTARSSRVYVGGFFEEASNAASTEFQNSGAHDISAAPRTAESRSLNPVTGCSGVRSGTAVEADDDASESSSALDEGVGHLASSPSTGLSSKQGKRKIESRSNSNSSTSASPMSTVVGPSLEHPSRFPRIRATSPNARQKRKKCTSPPLGRDIFWKTESPSFPHAGLKRSTSNSACRADLSAPGTRGKIACNRLSMFSWATEKPLGSSSAHACKAASRTGSAPAS